MKPEDITIAHYSEYSAVYVNGDCDSSYHRPWMTDCKERAEKRRQELIDALPKPRFREVESYAAGIWEGGMMWHLPVPVVPFRDRILKILNEAEE